MAAHRSLSRSGNLVFLVHGEDAWQLSRLIDFDGIQSLLGKVGVGDENQLRDFIKIDQLVNHDSATSTIVSRNVGSSLSREFIAWIANRKSIGFPCLEFALDSQFDFDFI